MKRIIVITVTLLTALTSFAQNPYGKADDEARLVLNTYVPDQIEGISSIARNALENKLSQIATQNGLGGGAYNPRFIITANLVVLDKSITSTVPPMHAYSMDVNLYIGDGIDGVLFSSYTVSVKGVGNNETKAFLNGINNIKSKSPEYQRFLEEGKRKIIEYYNANCDLIITQAQGLESLHQYDAAISTLYSVPTVCRDCYQKCISLLAPIFKKKIDMECEMRLTDATNVWNAGQDYDHAIAVARILSGIDPSAACYSRAAALASRVSKRMVEIDRREWNFLMKQQQDAVDIQKLAIKAARDIGVAYGNNQPRVIYNIRGWW
ncbi:MAG: hypothetical protein PHG29_06535 [Prolixibacteraceae bacterium]|nr:hypothetical protein [Prolixibacteraceae bacterium]